ncbi:hypothetical protein VNO80_26733 [Phaseolus coccineus]|uniref:Uncharacterized protein n=1 Tax=Phaseolus coccineus TaxID=3886 RepID=A0AAN9LFJ3_PHACN
MRSGECECKRGNECWVLRWVAILGVYRGRWGGGGGEGRKHKGRGVRVQKGEEVVFVSLRSPPPFNENPRYHSPSVVVRPRSPFLNANMSFSFAILFLSILDYLHDLDHGRASSLPL